MANWQKIKSSAKRMAKSAIKGTGEAADIASLHIKLKSLENKRDKEYETLGKLTYNQLKGEESLADKISESVIAIDKLKADIAVMKEKIEIAKKEHAEARAKDKQAAVEKELAKAKTKEEYQEKK